VLSSTDQPSSTQPSQWQNVLVALAAALGMFLAALDISVNVALPSIRTAFATDLQTVQWVIVVFIATRAGLVMGAGSFADRFGLKPVYIFGTVTYLVAMVVISLSPTLPMVVGFRVLQALGTGCLFAVSPAMVAQIFPRHRQGLGMGFTTASQALGMLAGTLGAGLLVQQLGWQAAFAGRIPFLLVAIALGTIVLRRSPVLVAHPAFDLKGAAALMTALMCLVIGLRLGASSGWTAPPVLVLLPLAPVFLLLFWWLEGQAAWPIVPKTLLSIGGFRVSTFGIFIAYFGVFVIWFIFPFYISDGLARGPLTLGVMLALMASLNVVCSLAGGWVSDKITPSTVGICGLVVLALGLLSMGGLDTDSSLLQVGIRIAIVGAGLGLFQSASYALMMRSVPMERYGTAAAALSLAQAFGMVLAVSTVGTLFAWSQGHHLSTLMAQGVGVAELEGRVFVLAFQDVFRLGAGIVALGAMVLLFRMLARRVHPLIATDGT